MAKTIGVAMTNQIVGALLEDFRISRPLARFPEDAEDNDALIEIPADELCTMLSDRIFELASGASDTGAVGIAMPGIVRNGILEDSPNLPQLKGAHVAESVNAALAGRGLNLTVTVFNDADAVAAGIAATRGHTQADRMLRVWTIGNGIGFGRFPYTEGPWEGGHMTVTLDPKERFCGCGGLGHLEGIMGHRAMRLRFLDMEPDEIFTAAKKGDRRCAAFLDLWHRALAAATASQIHLEGPGRFYFTGRDIDRLDLALLRDYLYQMVKMSPLQSYTVEVLPEDPTLAVIGAGAAAAYAAPSR